MTTPNLRSILVTTDLTHRCDARVASAAALAEAMDARLHALHVVHGAPRPGAEQLERGERRLARQLARVIPPSVRVASQRVMGCAPDLAVAEAAVRTGAELIVLGPVAALTCADRLFGDPASGGMGVPVLVVREPLEVPLTRVAAALRTGEPRGRALDWALRWGAALGPRHVSQAPVELSVVHVLPPGSRTGTPASVAALTEAEERVRVSREISLTGRPCDEITWMLERERPSLLVMDLDTRHALSHGGWTQLVRTSAIPMLVVPNAASAAARPPAPPRTAGRERLVLVPA